MDLARNGIELDPDIETPDFPQTQRQEIEKERPVALRINRNHFPSDVFPRLVENILKIGGLPAKPSPVINDFTLNLVFTEIDKRH
jgi:hypothetical protein